MPSGVARVLAYLTASFGVLLLIRPKSPPSKPSGPPRMVPPPDKSFTPPPDTTSSSGRGGFLATQTGLVDQITGKRRGSKDEGSSEGPGAGDGNNWGGGGAGAFAAALLGEWQQAGRPSPPHPPQVGAWHTNFVRSCVNAVHGMAASSTSGGG